MIRLIVGLGNPGGRYADTRHNVGYRVVDEIARRVGAPWSSRSRLDLAEARVGGGKLFLLKPTTFMNASGEAVGPFARFHKLEPHELLVVHDDLDLPLGRLRLRLGGSSGGQNGVRDMIRALGTDRFARLKIGVSRPTPGWTGANWVLAGFAPEERELAGRMVLAGADAAALAGRDGLLAAQAAFNSLDLRPVPIEVEPPASDDPRPARPDPAT